MSLSIQFDNSYARLPEQFYARLAPTSVREPVLVKSNQALASELGLDGDMLQTPEALAMFAGNILPEEAEPLAMAYAGHQFGNWVAQLGDGRAILLGEVIARDGTRLDIQLKGAGRTPFSRMGDGRAVLGPVLREYLVSEAMHALGIPTTRALAAVTTGERVIREAVLPGAILTRVARAHVRVGTFQFFAARQDHEALRTLADYMIERCYADAANAPNRYRSLLDHVVAAQAQLIAQWMGIGFIHGVMNTDNMSIAGETIDYGPCAFMDGFDPARVFSSIDQMGRYAYGRQPDIGHWNLACLARAMLPILADNEEDALLQGQEAIDAFPDLFAQAWETQAVAKLGLGTAKDGDAQLLEDLLKIMAATEADFTEIFRQLSDDPDGLDALLGQASEFAAWQARYQTRLSLDDRTSNERRAAMRQVNPAYIPRNHRVEEAIQAAYAGNLQPFERLLKVLQHPFDDQIDQAGLRHPPKPQEIVTATFCGT